MSQSISLSLLKTIALLHMFHSHLMLGPLSLVNAESAPDECIARRDARLGPVTNSCCRKFLYCRCVNSLCSETSQYDTKKCKGEIQNTCKISFDKACPKLDETSYSKTCPGVPINILLKDKWSSLAPNPSARVITQANTKSSMVIIISVCLVFVLLLIVAIVVCVCYLRNTSGSQNTMADKRSNKKKKKGKTDDASGESKDKLEGRNNKMNSSRSRAKQSSARISKRSRRGTSNQTKGRTGGGDPSFNSRQIKTVDRQSGPSVRPVITYNKFRKALAWSCQIKMLYNKMNYYEKKVLVFIFAIKGLWNNASVNPQFATDCQSMTLKCDMQQTCLFVNSVNFTK